MSRRVSLLILALALCLEAWAEVHLVGYVRDATTRAPLAGVTIILPGTDFGTVSTEQGGFSVDTEALAAVLRLSAVGYHTQEVTLNPGQAVLVVDMQPATVELSELEVNRTSDRYSKHNNPAVDLMQRVRASMRDSDPMQQADYFSFQKYQRLIYGFDDFDELAVKNKALRRFSFLGEYTDTMRSTGRRVLPLSVREQVSQCYHRRSPAATSERVEATLGGGIDEQLDQRGVKQYLEEVLHEVDIFQNDVTLLHNRFVSPLSAIGADFYKYYLTDTLLVDGERCVELSFVPRVPETYGFTGRLLVADADGRCFVKRVTMNVPHRIHLNYVDHLSIEQDFARSASGFRLLLRDDMEVTLRLVAGTPRLFARRETAFSGHSMEPPADMGVFNTGQAVAPDAALMPEEFWAEHRPHAMHTDGNTQRRMLTRLRESKWFKWTEAVILAFVKGYVPTGNPSRVDIGPINTTISGNALEGLRLRLGAVTTTALSPHLFARGYVAYGFRDRRWKYMAQLEYSFNRKRQFDQEFPIHSLRLMHRYDVDRLGQRYVMTNADNVFLALKRQRDHRLAYLRTTELEWKREWPSHFSVALGMHHLVHEGSRLMPFVQADGTPLARYTQAGFSATLRYAPGEKFYQTRSHRVPISMDAPIVALSHTWQPRGWMGTRGELHRTALSLRKRFWLSAFGHADVIVKGAKIWNRASFPDLLIANANLSYTIQPESYALLDAMEFVSDQTLEWDFTYWGGGALLSRVPLVKYLKLREVVTFRGLWGDLASRNRPVEGSATGQLLFPADAPCRPLGRTPYMELGVGLDNIFTILRVDYVWRLTYRGTPGVDRSGVRVALHFSF